MSFISEEEANQALEQFSDEYINESAIQYISVLKKVFSPFSKYNYFLEVGILQKIQETNEEDNSAEKKVIPKEFEFRSAQHHIQNNVNQQFEFKKIVVKLKDTSKITLDVSNFDSNFSVSSSHLKEFSCCGAILRLDSFSGFFGITNGYVFNNSNSEFGQKVHYPRKLNMTNETKNSEIGYLSWASNANLDAAIFEIEDEEVIKQLQEKGINRITNITTPKRGQLVQKESASGSETARIRSTNCSIKVLQPNGTVKIYRNQLQVHKISSSGDSGAVLFTKKSAVGMVFCSTNNSNIDNYSYANDLTKIFNHQFNTKQKWYSKGETLSIEQLTLTNGDL